MDELTIREQYLNLILNECIKLIEHHGISRSVGFSMGNPTSLLEIMNLMDIFRKLKISIFIKQHTPNANNIANVQIIPNFSNEKTFINKIYDKESLSKILYLFVNDDIPMEYFKFLYMTQLYGDIFKIITDLLELRRLNDAELTNKLLLWKLSKE